MDTTASSANGWQVYWKQSEGGVSLERRRICFERAHFIMQHCEIAAAPTIFDLGCGYSEVARHLVAEVPDARLAGFDWSEEAIRISRAATAAFRDRCTFAVADCCQDADFFKEHERQADVILSLGVVEHFVEPEWIVAQMARVLKKDGVLVLMTPNRHSSAPWCRRLKEALGTWKFGYQREYTTSQLRQWCERAGLEVLSEHVVQRRESPRGDSMLRLLSHFDKAMALVMPKWGFYSYVFAKKKS